MAAIGPRRCGNETCLTSLEVPVYFESIRSGVDHFGSCFAPERGVDGETNRIFHEMNRSISEKEICPARVSALEANAGVAEAAAGVGTAKYVTVHWKGDAAGASCPEVQRDRRPRCSTVGFPEVAVGSVRRERLAHHDRLAGAVPKILDP